MIRAFFVLLLFQLIGECLYRGLHLPVPGPVIGMALLTGWLLWRPAALDREMDATAWGLLRVLGLLFVPAGVGIVASMGLVRAQWWPITAGLMGSTAVALVGTAALMHWLLQRRGAGEAETETGTGGEA